MFSKLDVEKKLSWQELAGIKMYLAEGRQDTLKELTELVFLKHAVNV